MYRALSLIAALALAVVAGAWAGGETEQAGAAPAAGVDTSVMPASTRLVMERNPYFWWVDTEGRQLPYIDQVTFNLVTDRAVINLKASAGELDFQFRHLSPTNFTLFKENEERGGYRIISINLSNKGPDKRAVVSAPRFRNAMSYALNRNDINELVYGGVAGIPSQARPFPESPFHLPELAAAYVDYDPDQANALLDEMGLSARDGKGFRLGLLRGPRRADPGMRRRAARLRKADDRAVRGDVPGMILAETSLSFLGLGLRAPVTSWGVLLKEAQNVQTVGINPWLILPVFAVIGTVLAHNSTAPRGSQPTIEDTSYW